MITNDADPKKALRPYRKKLQQALVEAAATATTPGQARTWFVPYLAAVLRVYLKLTKQVVDNRPLSRALAKQSRDAFFKLLKSSKRDPKTRSRWAAVLANAHKSDISPEQFQKWLKKGGGVAGRAAELANLTRTPNQTAKQPPHGTKNASPLHASPEANNLVAEATNNSNEQS
jgi:hypothetical protein